MNHAHLPQIGHEHCVYLQCLLFSFCACRLPNVGKLLNFTSCVPSLSVLLSAYAEQLLQVELYECLVAVVQYAAAVFPLSDVVRCETVSDVLYAS